MTRMWRSFRVRLLVGAAIWTTGLLYLAHVLSVLFIAGPRAWGPPSRFLPMLPVAIAALVVGLLIVTRALRSFAVLRDRLADVHHGRDRRVSGEYLSEIAPLVADLNTLLEHRDRRVAAAIAKAGDLAHGLKTPLAVLRHDADRAAARGDMELAESIRQQVDRMSRHIDYHLAHARAAASGATPGARCVVAESASAVVRALERLHAGRGLSIGMDVPALHVIRAHREDLDEMLGNLLDNACKWARSRVRISSHEAGDGIALVVEDDGPGIPPELRERVLVRGVRADEAGAGSGLGLAIVRDLADTYGGRIVLDSSPLGGVRARLTLPAAGIQTPFSRGEP